jgi:hypothetical protein
VPDASATSRPRKGMSGGETSWRGTKPPLGHATRGTNPRLERRARETKPPQPRDAARNKMRGAERSHGDPTVGPLNHLLGHMMATSLHSGDIIRIPGGDIDESVIDEVFDAETAERMKRTHPVGTRCDRMVARDPGDNLIVIREGAYHYWDHESDQMILLGSDPKEFAAADDV